jgi:NAD(P)-dependent dehydrogenase (short-subunit alcohol dehydrogenase family)
MRIEPKEVALVTGAAGGLGLELARALGRAGMRVVAADIDAQGAKEAARALVDEGLSATGVALDVRSRTGWEDVARSTEAMWGPVSVLCNNAGISALDKSVSSMDWDYWDLTLQINLGGVFNGARTFLPRMLARGTPGYIVNTASAAALGTIPENGAAYVAGKYGVLGLTESLRREVASTPVRVAVLCPGAVKTQLWSTTRVLRGLPALHNPPAESASRSGSPQAMEPSAVAERVVQAIRHDEFYIVTHAHYRRAIESRHAEIIAAIEKT